MKHLKGILRLKLSQSIVNPDDKVSYIPRIGSIPPISTIILEIMRLSTKQYPHV